ncbi:hypothetical protein CL634_11615 [bacterium]|nr:hypothetical protein [bacterium]
MADPRIEQWREYVGEDPRTVRRLGNIGAALYPLDDISPDLKRSLDHRRRLAQRLRERGIHVPVPEANVDIEKYEDKYGVVGGDSITAADLFFSGSPGSEGIVDIGRNLPEFEVKLGALPGMTQREIDKATEDTAKTIQTGIDYGTLPFYFTPLAPVAGAADISRGLIEKSPIEMAIGMWGVSKPLQKMARTMPQKTEDLFIAGGSLAALPYAINDVYDFLSNLGMKAAEAQEPPVGGV